MTDRICGSSFAIFQGAVPPRCEFLHSIFVGIFLGDRMPGNGSILPQRIVAGIKEGFDLISLTRGCDSPMPWLHNSGLRLGTLTRLFTCIFHAYVQPFDYGLGLHVNYWLLV